MNYNVVEKSIGRKVRCDGRRCTLYHNSVLPVANCLGAKVSAHIVTTSSPVLKCPTHCGTRGALSRGAHW